MSVSDPQAYNKDRAADITRPDRKRWFLMMNLYLMSSINILVYEAVLTSEKSWHSMQDSDYLRE
jgi:hypothetical protein